MGFTITGRFTMIGGMTGTTGLPRAGYKVYKFTAGTGTISW